MPKEWGDDGGMIKMSVRLCCWGCAQTWQTTAIRQYGSTTYEHPKCPKCGEVGVEDV